jgi:UDP-N-acetylmuramyl pentapeptide phosphotransferase/UDP-N-acetylglucosamine-1-phosphate transferase
MFDFLILIITLIFFLLIEKEIVRFKFFPIDKPDRIKKIHLKPTTLSGGIFICSYTILILIFFYLFELENIDYLKTIILLAINYNVSKILTYTLSTFAPSDILINVSPS